MKRILSICIIAILMAGYLIPFTSYAAEASISDGNTIYTNIDDFLAKKSYYDALVQQGIGICVSVGDEYSDAEVEQLLGLPSSTNKSSSMNARGTSVPTETYNIHTSPDYEIPLTTAEFSIIYTNKKFTGCTLYVIDLFNYDYDNNLTITVYGTKNGTVRYTAKPRSYFYQPIRTNSSNDTFFFAFSPPCEVAGYVTCCPAQ